MTRALFAAGLVAVLCSTTFAMPAFAQQVPTDDPVASAPIRIGAFGVNPRLSLSNLGVDTKPRLATLKVVEPAKRSAGIKVASVDELVAKLKTLGIAK